MPSCTCGAKQRCLSRCDCKAASSSRVVARWCSVMASASTEQSCLLSWSHTLRDGSKSEIIHSSTTINYGSSIAARAWVNIGHYCHLGHYTFVMDNDKHGVVRRMESPQSDPVVIEDHVWIGSKAFILAASASVVP